MHLFTRPMHLHQILSWIVILILLFLFLAKKNWRVFKCLYSCYLTQWCTQLYACNVAVWSKVKIAPSHLGCSEIDYIYLSGKKTKQALLKCYRIKKHRFFFRRFAYFWRENWLLKTHKLTRQSNSWSSILSSSMVLWRTTDQQTPFMLWNPPCIHSLFPCQASFEQGLGSYISNSCELFMPEIEIRKWTTLFQIGSLLSKWTW